MNFTRTVTQNNRNVIKRLLKEISLEDLNKIPEGFNNNIIWNIGHILVTEQLLVYKLSNLPLMVSDSLVEKYKKGTKPNADVTTDEVNEIKSLLFSTIEKTKEDYNLKKFKDYQEYTVSTTGNTLSNIDDALNFVHFHEGMHLGYVLALIRALIFVT